MNENIKYFLFIITTGIILFFIQVSNLNPIPLINIPVNYLEVLVLYFGLFSGLYTRLFTVFYFGLLIDLWFVSCSFYTFSFLAVSNLIFFVSKNTKVNFFFLTFAIILGTLLSELINASLIGFCVYSSVFNSFQIYWNSVIKLIIGNVFFFFLIFPLMKKNIKEHNMNWY